MKTDIIKAIFTNVLFVIGVIFLIAGFIIGTQTVTRSVLFENYPLNSYDENRCEFEQPFPTIIEKGDEVQSESPEEIENRKQKCLAGLAHDRKVKQTEDIVGSVTSLVAGAALVFSFRRFIFK